MSERQVGVGIVYAVVLWVCAATCISGGALIGILSDSRGGLGWAIALLGLGLGSSAAAATLTIGNMFRRQDRMLQQAFDLGCEASNVRRFSG